MNYSNLCLQKFVIVNYNPIARSGDFRASPPKVKYTHLIPLVCDECCVLQIDADNYEKEGKLAKIRADRGYNYDDCITCTPEKLPNYEQKV